MGDKRPPRQVTQAGDREVVEYHFKVDVTVATHIDEKRLRKLIEDELLRVKAAMVGKKP